MKTLYLHSEQMCRVTFIKAIVVEDDADEDAIWATVEEGSGELLGVHIGDTSHEIDENIHEAPDLPSHFYREPDPKVRLILDLSTAHVSEPTSLMLNTWAELATPPGAAIVHSKGEYGWMVYVPSEMPSREERHLIPDDLWAVMVKAHSLGCDWIMFDRDGDTMEGLDVFDW